MLKEESQRAGQKEEKEEERKGEKEIPEREKIVIQRNWISAFHTKMNDVNEPVY